MGDFVVAYLESGKPTIGETLYAAATDPTDLGRWFVEMVKEIHGVDMSQPQSGPQLEIVGDWSDPDVGTRG